MDGLICDHSTPACWDCREDGRAFDPVGDVGRALREAQARMNLGPGIDLSAERAEINRLRAASDRADLRDRFAMAALTGLLANPRTIEVQVQPCCATAYLVADGMLAALERKP